MQNITNFNIEDFNNVENKNRVFDVVDNNDIAIIRGFVTVSLIKKFNDNEFVYAVYDFEANWDEDLAEFDENFIRDSGNETDIQEAIDRLFDTIDEEERRG